MHHETEIRRRQDGSIDTAYYMAKGKAARSAQAEALTKQSVGWLPRLLQKLVMRQGAPVKNQAI